MNFRTEIKLDITSDIISHRHPIIMFGSCFSDEVGDKLSHDFFDVDINPFGTLYNPSSIAQAIERVISNYKFTTDDLILIDGDKRFHSFSHHSSFSSANAEQMLSNINARICNAYQSILAKSATIIITFGSAYVFSYKLTNTIVSNCHKLPQSNFNRFKLSVEQIVTEWTNLLERLTSLNPTLNIIMTVSPIRHLADGAHGNQLSKSTLLLAIDSLSQKFKNIIYFPSYEILMDDLRDYRFYANDMVHPSAMAVDYVYDNFLQSFCSNETQQLAQRCRKIYARLNHRHMTEDTDVIEKFNTATTQLCSQLINEHPYLNKPINKITRQI